MTSVSVPAAAQPPPRSAAYDLSQLLRALAEDLEPAVPQLEAFQMRRCVRRMLWGMRGPDDVEGLRRAYRQTELLERELARRSWARFASSCRARGVLACDPPAPLSDELFLEAAPLIRSYIATAPVARKHTVRNYASRVSYALKYMRSLDDVPGVQRYLDSFDSNGAKRVARCAWKDFAVHCKVLGVDVAIPPAPKRGRPRRTCGTTAP